MLAMISQLSALSEIMSSGIATIEATYAKHGVSFPSLNDPFQPVSFDDSELMETTNHVISAASQLIAMLKPPHSTILEGGFAHFHTSSLGAVITANIPEILREAGPQGLHIRDIGEKCGADPQKIGRVLRYLATNHIFQEVSLDVFSNNRLSLVLDTGKSVASIKQDPISKHDNTLGLAALIGHCADEAFKASAFFTESLLDSETAASQDPLDCPFSRAHGREPVFEFFDKPENEYRLRRLDAAMHGASLANRSDIIVTGFDWGALKKGEIVVDVGGGIGSVTLMLAKAFPHLQFVVQDRPKVITPTAIKFWKNEYPEAFESGRVKLLPHDFFSPQPIQNASVFFLRYITHDWPDAHTKKIIRQLRPAASPTTKLIFIDHLIPYSAPSNEAFKRIPGAAVPDAPFPLLPNLGTVSHPAVMADLQMMTLNNGQERTIGQFIDLVDGTGWKIESISRSSKSVLTLIVFSPVDAAASL